MISTRLALPEEYEIVGEFIFQLLSELFPADQFPDYADQLDKHYLTQTAKSLLESDSRYWSILALDQNQTPIGVITLNECAAIYAGGSFGEIPELYVKPEQRSADTGRQLIDAACAFGRRRGWNHLEVGAPDVPRFVRTVNFYKKCGFTEVGPRLEFGLSP